VRQVWFLEHLPSGTRSRETREYIRKKEEKKLMRTEGEYYERPLRIAFGGHQRPFGDGGGGKDVDGPEADITIFQGTGWGTKEFIVSPLLGAGSSSKENRKTSGKTAR